MKRLWHRNICFVGSCVALRVVLCVAARSCPSVVDDQFFKLSELECFLEHEDRREAGQHSRSSSSDESVDLFQPLDDDTDEVGVYSFDLSHVDLLPSLFHICDTFQ
jgi:hypothetical protein